MDKLTLMAVFAHPDDEAFGTGGTLTKYAAEGCEVHLVTATRGEAGRVKQPDVATKANLPEVREQELRCACQIYGIHPPHFLDYNDGLLPIVHQGQAVGKVVRLIREIRPQVIITFGPEGIYGHYDHIAVHRWTTIAVNLAAKHDCFPHHRGEGCEPYQVSKVYYRVLPQERIEAMGEDDAPTALTLDGVPFYFVGREFDEITTVIDVSEYVEQKLRGIQCHTTQVTRDSRFFEAPEEVKRDPYFRREHFTLAHSSVGQPEGVETDLFVGLRQ